MPAGVGLYALPAVHFLYVKRVVSMGTQDVQRAQDSRALRKFAGQLIQDVRAMEHMLNEGLFETGITRIGAEQELFIIDERLQPASLAEEVLAKNTDPRLVNELTRFNLEFNMDPRVFTGACLREMEQDLTTTLEQVRTLVRKEGGEIILIGILPTIRLSDLTLTNMTPRPRYYALNDAILGLRGGTAQFHIRGVDELYLKHDSIMLEGCNTSFQTHYQVDPEDFAVYYNAAQVIAAPSLAAATNSPVLFGKRLWSETRIALFEQAVDTRSSNLYLRVMSPRVHFGSDWVKESVTEIFKEDISRFRVLLASEGEIEDPFQALDEGHIPKLKALQLHNSTVYRWNRACYGITDGKPHLRIENRVLPSGPTPLDEIANAAFWFGAVRGLVQEYGDFARLMNFDDVKGNFTAASRQGANTKFQWLSGPRISAPELICKELLPLARQGLASVRIDSEDIDRYLGTIQARMETRQTGAQWMISSLSDMRGKGTRSQRLNAVVRGTIERQKTGAPVHTWDRATLSESTVVPRIAGTMVEDHMSTDIYTVNEEELVELVACLMDWQRIRHVIVEDDDGCIVGLVTYRNLLRYLSEHGSGGRGMRELPVRDIMIVDPFTIAPDEPTKEAIALMRERRISALPVVRDRQVVGIITERHFLDLARDVLVQEE